MAPPRMTDILVQEAKEAVAKYGSVLAAARALGLPESTLRRRYDRARDTAIEPKFAEPDNWQGEERAFEFPTDTPNPNASYEEIKARQLAAFNRLHAHREAVKLIKVQIKIDGPYGVLVMGDPHVDHHGTDWPTLDAHTQLIKNTRGLFGANVGDLTNNWVGRLARLYGEQNMGRQEAVILAEGWLREVPWLWIDPGNHDLWSGADDPVRWLMRFANLHYKWQGSRLMLTPPSGTPIIVNSRHDHPGHSMYHPTHGPLKASIWDGFHDDVYTCGHKHIGGYLARVHPTGKFSHAIRLSSYKVYDNHKDEQAFLDAHLPAVTLLINPHAKTNSARVHVALDPEEAADMLTSARRRFDAAKSVESFT